MSRARMIGLALLVLSVTREACADVFTVTLDTSPLSGAHTLIFGLTDLDAGINTISLSDFDFGGGSIVAGSDDCTLGGLLSGVGCSGDLSSSVVLQDLEPLVLFAQQFNPGLALTFTLTTTNDFVGPFPDQFSMFLCDLTGTCYSDDPAATGALLLLDLVGGILSASSFIVFGAAELGLAAPVVTAVPEPMALVMLGGGVAAVMARRRVQSIR